MRGLLNDLSVLRNGRSGRHSSWDTSGRNADAWVLAPGETRVLSIALFDHVEAFDYAQAHIISISLVISSLVLLNGNSEFCGTK